MVIDLAMKSKDNFPSPFKESGFNMLYKFEESQYFCIRQIKFVTENIQLIKIAYFHQDSMKPFLRSEFSNNNFANKKEVL